MAASLTTTGSSTSPDTTRAGRGVMSRAMMRMSMEMRSLVMTGQMR